MSVTFCLGDFAKRLQRAPRSGWKEIVEAVPERCERGCKVDCREVCAEYARMQWRMAVQRGGG